MLSRRLFLRWLAGACAAFVALRLGLRAVRAEGPSHEDLVDDADGFALGVLQGCQLEQGRIIADRPASFTSRELVANAPFTHAGLHWEAESGGDELVFALRARDIAGTWSPWRQVRLERRDGQCPASGVFAALAFTGEHTQALQYRVDFPGSTVSLERVVASALSSPTAQLGRSDGLTVRRLSEGASSPPSPVGARIILPLIADDTFVLPGDATHASDPWHGRLLEVIPREVWGADESLRFDGDGHELWHEMFVPVRALVVHHASTRNSYDSPEEAATDIRAIHYYHSVIEGWHDIGYNALLDRFGNLYEGRHGRGGDPGDLAPREVLSEGVSAGHVHLHNYGGAGIGMLGDATEDGWPLVAPEGPMWDALVRYCSFEAARAGLHLLDPANPGVAATSDFLRSDNAWHDGIPNLGSHRDSEQTLCPGDIVIDLLPDLRAAVDASLAGMSRSGVSLTRVGPAEREALPGARISYRWYADQPEPGWELAGFQYAIEAWFKPDGIDDITYLHGYTAEQQPRLAWTGVSPGQLDLSFVAEQPGQYTMHVRALLHGPGGLAPAAFEAHDSVLIRQEPATSP
jgi:hypothetical protein